MGYPGNVIPQRGESLIGLAHRLASVNALPHFRVLADDIGHSYDSTVLSDDSVAALAIKAGTSASDIANRQLLRHPSSKNGSVTLCEDEFQQDMVHIRCSRLCPECVADGRPHLLNWQFDAITHCLIHRTPLIAKCPTCETDLTWRRKRYDLCRRGHDICIPARTAEDNLDLAGMTFVDNMLNELRGIPSRRGRRASGIPKLDCSQTIVLLTFLAQIALYDPSENARPLRFDRPRRRDFLSVGLSLAQEWPQRFVKHVTAIAVSDSTELLPEPMRQWIAKRASVGLCPAERLVLTELDNCAQRLSRLPVAGKQARFHEHAPAPIGFIRKREFAKRAGLCLHAVDAIFSNHDHASTRPGKGAGPSLIPVHLAAQFIENKNAPRISFSATARRFKVKSMLVPAMVGLGLFGADARWRGRHCPWRGLYASEVEHFEHSLRNALNDQAPACRVISLHTINKGPGSERIIPALLKAIIDGAVPAYGTYDRLYSPKISFKDWQKFQKTSHRCRHLSGDKT